MVVVLLAVGAKLQRDHVGFGTTPVPAAHIVIQIRAGDLDHGQALPKTLGEATSPSIVDAAHGNIMISSIQPGF